MKIKSGFAKRAIVDSNVVVPVGKTAAEFNGMITLNDSAAFFWDCFQEDTTIDEVVAKVTEQYDVNKEKAREDIEKFVDMLRENNLLDE